MADKAAQLNVVCNIVLSLGLQHVWPDALILSLLDLSWVVQLAKVNATQRNARLALHDVGVQGTVPEGLEVYRTVGYLFGAPFVGALVLILNRLLLLLCL